MSVDSYLELFTTLFGWTFYNIFWEVLVGTGIVFLPFLGILIDHWREPAEGGEFGSAPALSLRRMEIQLFMALLVVVLAGQPAALAPLEASTLAYTPPPSLLDPSPVTATVASPQSSFGASGFAGAPSLVHVPVWWYAVLAVASGLNHAVVEGLPSASDFRTYEQQARLATIADPALRREAGEFFSQCYVPARSRYLAERPSGPAIQSLLATYGPGDPDWMGSHVYREIPGYYDALRPSMPVPGWAFDAVRDSEYPPGSAPRWGKPWCKQWWEEAGIGAAPETGGTGESSPRRASPAWWHRLPRRWPTSSTWMPPRAPCWPTRPRCGRTTTWWRAIPGMRAGSAPPSSGSREALPPAGS